MKGESRSGVSQEANSAALTVRVAWTWRRSRSRRGSQRRNSRFARELLPPPAAGGGDGEQRQLGREQRRRQQDQQRGRVGADEEGEAVALEPAPLVLAGAELVVVVDDRGRLDPERAAAQPQPQREVDVLVVEEEALGEAADLVPGPQRDRQAGAGEDGDLAGRRRRGDRLAVAAGPDDAGEVDRVAGGVDPGPPRVGDQRLPGGPAAALAARAGGSPRRSRAAAPRRG